MNELSGIYLERGNIYWKDITPRHMQALCDLGVELHVDGDAKVVRIIADTSEQEHEHCCEPPHHLDWM